MLEIQESYDSTSFLHTGRKYQDILKTNGYFFAILDEIGEWNHESKSKWCWFRKCTYDHSKALEEFSDIFHMTLSFVLAMVGKEQAVIYFEQLDSYFKCPESQAILLLLESVNILEDPSPAERRQKAFQALNALFQLSRSYDDKEIMKAFKEKNDFNLKRLSK